VSHLLNGPCAQLSLVVTATLTPAILRHCPRCKVDRPFKNSGKFRVNAQKKRVDIWLIFRCGTCDQTWNHAIHERQSVRALAPDILDAFMRNDPALADRHAAALGGQSASASPAELQVTRYILAPVSAATIGLRIVIAAPPGNLQRLDRVLATGLAIPRAEVTTLAERGALHITNAGEKALRRPALDGQEVLLDLQYCHPALAALRGQGPG
jgi:hypothetical protein